VTTTAPVWPRQVQVTLAGWPAVSGSPATGPGAFQVLATTAAFGPGTYTVSWTLTLSGTPGSADVNNARLVLDGTTFLVESVNAGAAGTYPQAPFTFTVPPGSHTLAMTVGPVNANSGAVYTAAIGGQGNGTASLGPGGHGITWTLGTISVRTAQTVATGTCQCTIYVGDDTSPVNFLDSTFSGDTGDSTDAANGQQIRLGKYVFAVWSGGVANDIATLTLTGTMEVP
jgi:hypothetical protein